nr:hypothetical protein [Tanacetum cinerariifolium]
MRKTINDDKVGSNLSDDNKKKVDDAIDEIVKWLDVASLRQKFFHSIAPGGLAGDRREENEVLKKVQDEKKELLKIVQVQDQKIKKIVQDNEELRKRLQAEEEFIEELGAGFGELGKALL